MRIRADQEEAAKDIYQELLDAGVKLDHHESDLYAQKTPESDRIVRNYQFKSNVKVFRDNIDHELWYDIPFAFSPFWAKRQDWAKRGSVAAELVKIAKSLVAVEEADLARLPSMSISDIARVIYQDHKEQGRNIYFGAVPYLEAMSTLQTINDNYMEDSGVSVVAYALSNLTSYRGPVAVAVKKELNRRLKMAR